MIRKTLELKQQGNGEYLFCASDQNLDRDNEKVMFSSWNTENFENLGAPILYGHDQKSLPIGSGKIIKDDVTKRLLVSIKFAGHQLAKDVNQLVDDRILLSLSVGFIPHQFTFDEEGHKIFTSVELLEISVVPCASNIRAVLLSKGFSGERLKALDKSIDIDLDAIEVPKNGKTKAQLEEIQKEVAKDLELCYVSPKGCYVNHETYDTAREVEIDLGCGIKAVKQVDNQGNIPLIDVGAGIKVSPEIDKKDIEKQKELDTLRKFGWRY